MSADQTVACFHVSLISDRTLSVCVCVCVFLPTAHTDVLICVQVKAHTSPDLCVLSVYAGVFGVSVTGLGLY